MIDPCMYCHTVTVHIKVHIDNCDAREFIFTGFTSFVIFYYLSDFSKYSKS